MWRDMYSESVLFKESSRPLREEEINVGAVLRSALALFALFGDSELPNTSVHLIEAAENEVAV